MKRAALLLTLCALMNAEAFPKSAASPTEPISSEDNPDLFRKDAQVFSFHGEFLFWRVQEPALDYALSMETPAWGPTPSYAQGTYKTATFNGDPGFRIKTSFFRATRYWELWWQYTRLTGHGKNHARKPGPDQEFLTGTWPQITTAPLAGADSSLHLNYNVGDFLVTRVFIPNPHLRLRMVGGAIVAWMNQNWTITYRDSASRLTKIGSRWKYTAGGLRMGTVLDWFWTHDIYITGTATTGITLGTYENKTKQTTTFQPTGSDNTAIPIRDAKYDDVRPAFVVQASFGPSWQKSFSNSRVEVFAGYEINAWFNIHEVYRSTSGTASQAKETWINNGAIALQGLTTRVTVDF